MALEQPTISWLPFTNVGLFSDTAYLDRYGFIPDTIIPGKEHFRSGSPKAPRCSTRRARYGATREPRRR